MGPSLKGRLFFYIHHMLRICHVLHGIVGGGSEQVVLNYCSRMHGVQFDLLYQYEPNPQILERFKEAGFNCIRIPDKVHHPFGHLISLFRLLKKGKYDVVHSHLDWYMNAYVMFLAWFAGVPKRIAHHHQAYCPKNALVKFACALLRVPNRMFATHWLACGKAAAVNGWGRAAVAKGRVTVLPNAIDPERFKFDVHARKEIRERYGFAEDDFVVGHVGRFFPQKNHDFLIDVFAELCKVRPNSKLLLLGDGPLQNLIKSKVAGLGLTGKVVFAGLQKNPAPFYCAMDVFCFPSLWEGLPLTLVEAQYNGLDCFVSEVITKEAVVSENVFALPTMSKSLWVERIINKKTKARRIDIGDCRFDICVNLAKLEMLYKSPNGKN